MEVLFEILFQILVGILEVCAELLLQVVGEALVEWIGHGIKRILGRHGPADSRLAALGYGLAGATAGGVSLWLVPALFIKAGWLRVANLLLTPLAAGLFMAWMGRLRRRRGKETLLLEGFACGFCFALAMAAVRYAFGK